MVLYESSPLISVEYDPCSGTFVHIDNGYKIIESYTGDAAYMCYFDSTGNERKFILPAIPKAAEQLVELCEKYKDDAAYEQDLYSLVEEVYHTKASTFKDACDLVYQKPENYLKFLALRLLKSEFTRLASGETTLDRKQTQIVEFAM